MTEQKKPNKLLATVKAPLIFALILGLVAGVVTTITASGGLGAQIQSHGAPREIRLDLGLIAFGVAFIASLVVLAMLSLASKENPEHLSEGSGVSRRSEDRLKPQTNLKPGSTRAAGATSANTGPAAADEADLHRSAYDRQRGAGPGQAGPGATDADPPQGANDSRDR